MARSPYIDNVILTNKHSGKRTEKVQAFVIHHMAAKWTGKRCAEYFRDTPSKQASANYCIGYDGDVALNGEEENRAWTSSSNWADQRAISFELANSKMGEPWEVSDKTIRKAIIMLAEQHKRYGLKKATYTGDTKGTLWRHDWFAKTNCPGAYLGGKFDYIADEVNKILNEKPKVSSAKAYKVVTTVNGYINSADAKAKKNAKTKVKSGNYTVFSEANVMINVTTKVGVPGSWINPSDNKATASVPKPPLKSLDVIAKEVLDGKWGNDPERTKKITNAGYDAKAVQARVNELSKPVAKKTYVQLAAREPLWRVYRLGTKPVVGNEVGFLSPRQYGGLEYQILGYENNGTCAIIHTQAFGRVKIFIKDPSAKIVTR